MGFFCCQTLHLNFFCKANDISFQGDCYIAILLFSSVFENTLTWAILLPFLCLIIKSYYWSLHNYQALLSNGKSTVQIISNAIWSVIILKDFTSKYYLNFFTSHIITKHSCSVMRYFFLYSLKILLVQMIIHFLSLLPF